MGFKRQPQKARRMLQGQWDERHRWMLSLLRDYVEKHGWASVNHKLIVAPGARLGTWIGHRRAFYRRGELAGWLQEELESIPGWEWDPIRVRHRRHLDALFDFLEELDWDDFSLTTVYDNVRIGAWVAQRRADHAEGRESWVTDELEAIPGWTWTPRSDLFEVRVKLTDEYLTVLSATELLALGRWIRRRRQAYRAGELDKEKIRECESIPGWTWVRKSVATQE